MAVIVLRTGKDNFFLNIDGSISMQYDPAYNKSFLMNKYGHQIQIPIDRISIQKGGQIIFLNEGNKIIIDDGFRNKLIVSGYLYLNSTNLCEDYSKSKILDLIYKTLTDIFTKNVEMTSNSISTTMTQAGYRFSIEIETLNRLIERNIKRQEDNLPMYPTKRGMDKNTSFYFRIYSQRKIDTKISKSNEELKTLGNNLIYSLAKAIDPSQICNDEAKVLVQECQINRTIIKWEADK